MGYYYGQLDPNPTDTFWERHSRIVLLRVKLLGIYPPSPAPHWLRVAPRAATPRTFTLPYSWAKVFSSDKEGEA